MTRLRLQWNLKILLNVDNELFMITMSTYIEFIVIVLTEKGKGVEADFFPRK